MRPVVALLTDFGRRDHYAGTMKGVILGICPDAALVDLTHDIPPQDVLEGALQLAASYRFFPRDTIFLAVVDPGVGSARRAIAARAGEYHFVAPDNGLLAAVFAEAPPATVVELSEGRFARAPISRTFEGRDRLAPAAAWLARGVNLEDLGPVVEGYQRLAMPLPVLSGTGLDGEVLRVDGFGNLLTNISRHELERFAGDGVHGVTVLVAGRRAGPLVEAYASVEPGEGCALIGSDGHLEIAVNRGSAAARLGVGAGAPVSVRK
jgi:S-adenosylmethionine hydrolase